MVVRWYLNVCSFITKKIRTSKIQSLGLSNHHSHWMTKAVKGGYTKRVTCQTLKPPNLTFVHGETVYIRSSSSSNAESFPTSYSLLFETQLKFSAYSTVLPIKIQSFSLPLPTFSVTPFWFFLHFLRYQLENILHYSQALHF